MSKDDLIELTEARRLNRNALYGSLGTAVFIIVLWIISIAFTPVFAFDASRDVSLGLLTVIPLISAGLARYGHSRLGIWLIIIVIYATSLWSVLIESEGIGPLVAVLTLLVAGGIASFTLKQQDVNRTIVATLIGSSLIIVGDVLSPFDRLPNSSPTTLTIITVITVPIYSFFIYRQFRHYTLQVKLAIIVTGITLLSVVAIGGIVSAAIERNLTMQVTESLALQIEKQADFLGAIFVQKVGEVQALAIINEIKEALEEQNRSYNGDEASIITGIQALDAQWVTASDDDPLIQSIISADETVNSLAHQLYYFLEIFPDQTEVFITDKYGATLGATGRLSDYYQADEDWWQAAWNNGEGAIYISNPEYDESADVVAIQIALPVVGEEAGELLGIIRSTIVLDAFYEAIAGQRLGETGRTVLLDRNGNVLFEEVVEEGGGVQAMSPGLQQHLLQERPHSMLAEDEHGDLAVFAHAPAHVAGFTEDQAAGGRLSEFELAVSDAVQSLGWFVVFRQKASEAFAPLTTIATIIQLASVATVAVTAVLATLFARTVVRPLRALGNAAAEIGAGNLGVSLPPAGNDEVGELTTQFANMSNQLQKTVGELQQRTLVIETSSEVSRHLSTILDEQELMTTVVNQVRRGFNYYHAHIYLLNQSEDTLIMVAGTGQPAQEMLAQKHRIRLGEGLVGRAAETKETVLVSDVRQDPNWLPNALLPETKSEVAVPIIVGGQLLGVLDVQHNIINSLQGQDADLLELLANQIGIALQNARLFTQTQQQARQQALINEIGRKIQTAPTVERVLQTAAEELGEALGTQRTTVMLNSRGRTNGRN